MFCHIFADITFALLGEERRSKNEEEKGCKRGEFKHVPASCRHSDSYLSHHDLITGMWVMRLYLFLLEMEFKIFLLSINIVFYFKQVVETQDLT